MLNNIVLCRILRTFFLLVCGYPFLVIISSFEAIFCSISRHYSSKKVVILHFRKASECVMLMSSFHVLHDWTPCGNTANVQKIVIRFSMDPYFYHYKKEVLWLFEIFREKIVNSFKKEVDFNCTIVWSYNSAIEGNYLGGL